MRHQLWLLVALISAVCFSACRPVCAAGEEYEIDSLKGLRAVNVAVQFEPARLPSGLDDEEMREKIEGKLRKAGMTIAPDLKDPYSALYGVKIWYAPIRTEEDELIGYTYYVHCTLMQGAFAVRKKGDPPAVVAITWDTGNIGSCSPRKIDLVNGIEREADRITDLFCKDYRQAN